jgi:phosphopantetheine adenylyltransferase
MARTVFDVLTERIDEEISSAQVFLSGGSAKDYSQYKEIVGLIRGLRASKEYIEDLSRNYMDNDDD